MANYINWIRSKVGHEKVILVFAGGCLFDEDGKVLLQKRGDSGKWGFPGGAIELGETPEETAVKDDGLYGYEYSCTFGRHRTLAVRRRNPDLLPLCTEKSSHASCTHGSFRYAQLLISSC